MPTTATGCHQRAGSIMFDDFDQLTSVHVNSTDELFLASGYSKHVALYDISSGRRLQVFDDMHREHINVVKFAHHSPSIFATSSFDRDVKLWDLRQKPNQPCYTAVSSRGNVMVCFSPDDQYLLVSAVDNEVIYYNSRGFIPFTVNDASDPCCYCACLELFRGLSLLQNIHCIAQSNHII